MHTKRKPMPAWQFVPLLTLAIAIAATAFIGMALAIVYITDLPMKTVRCPASAEECRTSP